jgi:hypothetical protein
MHSWQLDVDVVQVNAMVKAIMHAWAEKRSGGAEVCPRNASGNFKLLSPYHTAVCREDREPEFVRQLFLFFIFIFGGDSA